MDTIEKIKVYRMLGYTEHVNSCDCCGKQDLKGTIAMEDTMSGQISYFGTTCAGYMNRVTEKVIVHQLSKVQKANLLKAKQELRGSPENIAFNKALAYLDTNPPIPKDGKTIGMLRVEYLQTYDDALTIRRKAIGAKYYIKGL